MVTIYQCNCLLYTSDAADDSLRVDLGGRRIIKIDELAMFINKNHEYSLKKHVK